METDTQNQWSPEPWKVDHWDRSRILDVAGLPIIKAAEDEVGNANIKRVFDCVKFCEGVSSDLLAQMESLENLRKIHRETCQQLISLTQQAEANKEARD
jgi:hypothetical protein